MTTRPGLRRALALSVLTALSRASVAAAQPKQEAQPEITAQPQVTAQPEATAQPTVAPSIPEQSVSLADLDSQLGTEPLAAAEPARGLSVYGFADAGWHKYFLRPGSLLADRYRCHAITCHKTNRSFVQ